MTFDQLLQMGERFGLPAAIVFALFTGAASLASAAWIGIRALANWAGPRIDKLADRHTSFLDSMEATQKQIAESIHIHHVEEQPKLDAIHAGVKDLFASIDEVHGNVLKIRDRSA